MSWSDGIAPSSPTFNIASSMNSAIRVMAGPGTGKSFAMKRRVAKLLEDGVEPSLILPVTFTRVAAEDLHRELIGMGVPGCEELSGVTLHSLALRILMRNHVLASTGRIPRPLNEFELEPLIADLKTTHGGKKATKKKKQAYEAAWSRLQHEEPGYSQTPDDQQFESDLLAWLSFHNSMLIGEVIPILYGYLRANPAASERNEFSHILVDEFQDLNKAEQGVIGLLSDSAAVCVVGDDDQSIYSFKHAHPEGIRDWLSDNPSADDLQLDECYRCPTTVVAMANSLISYNSTRPQARQLTPMPTKGAGDVRICQYPTLEDEIAGLSNFIEGLIDAGTPAGDILVLAQRSAIGTPIFRALLDKGIPAKSYYAEAELDHTEAQKSFALLKLLVDQNDRVALRWLIGINGNNWHAAGYKRVRESCEFFGSEPWAVLSQLESGELQLPYTQGLVSAFTEIKDRLSALQECPDLTTLIDQLFPSTEPNLGQIRNLSLEIIENEEPTTTPEFLEKISEAISQPEIPSEIEDVRIMSLHKSKGLSSPVTIIAGCVEGLLPIQPDPDLPEVQQAAQLEEARRLFFVGITRVKAAPDEGKVGTLILTSSRQMPMADAMRAGIAPAGSNYGTANLNASRFIRELGPNAPTPTRSL